MIHVRIATLIYLNLFARILLISMSILRLILCSPLSLYKNWSLIRGKEVWIMCITYSAVSPANIACLFPYLQLPLYLLVPKNQRCPGRICTGIPYSCFQRPSQRNTLPLSTKKHPPTSQIYSQLCNLTVVNQPCNVKDCIWYCIIRTKAKYKRDIVVMRQDVVVMLLNVSFPWLMQI